jgi:DNA-directed RNA polymerase, beta' subunit/160 kD subunit
LEDPTDSPPNTLSRSVLRIEMSEDLLIEKDIWFSDIVRHLREDLDDDIQIIASDDNDSPHILRLRARRTPDAASKLTSGNVNMRSVQEDKDHAFLVQLRSYLLQEYIIRGIPEIEKVFISKEPSLDGEFVLETNGSAFSAVLACPFVDSRRTTCNDICETYATLGIEATRATLLNEIHKVISF